MLKELKYSLVESFLRDKEVPATDLLCDPNMLASLL
jgi:hypothetical protein